MTLKIIFEDCEDTASSYLLKQSVFGDSMLVTADRR